MPQNIATLHNMTQDYATLRIAARVRAARRLRALSIGELATASGVSRTTIDRIEAGKHSRPQMRTIRALAGALDVAPDQLVSDAV